MCVYKVTRLWLWSVTWRGVEGEKEVCVQRKRQVDGEQRKRQKSMVLYVCGEFGLRVFERKDWAVCLCVWSDRCVNVEGEMGTAWR